MDLEEVAPPTGLFTFLRTYVQTIDLAVIFVRD